MSDARTPMGDVKNETVSADLDEMVQAVASELLAHGEFASTMSANVRNAEAAARAVLRLLALRQPTDTSEGGGEIKHVDDCPWDKTRMTLQRRCTCGALDPAPPSPAVAGELEVVAWMHPTAGWSRTKYHSILPHCLKTGPGPVALVTLSSATSRIQRAERERDDLAKAMIIAPAECDEECDDPDCPYQHKPLTLRRAYNNAVSRMQDAEDEARRHHRAMADFQARATAAEAQLEEARKVLEPFAFHDWTDEHGWTDAGCPNDRICDWFGPSDFRAARALYTSLGEKTDAE